MRHCSTAAVSSGSLRCGSQRDRVGLNVIRRKGVYEQLVQVAEQFRARTPRRLQHIGVRAATLQVGQRRVHQFGVAAAKRVDRLLHVADEDHPLRQMGELHEQRQLHRVRVLEFVHQQQLELVFETLAHLRVVHGAQCEMFHVGEIDQAALGLQLLKAIEALCGDRVDAFDVGADVAVKLRAHLVTGRGGAHRSRISVVTFRRRAFAQRDPLQPRTILLLQQVVSDLQSVEVFARGLGGVEQGIDVGARVVDRTRELGAMIADLRLWKVCEQCVRARATHRKQRGAANVVVARAIGDLADLILPSAGRQARGETVHCAHVRQIGDLVQRLMEQAAVFHAEHVQFRRQPQFERESLQQALANAVHGTEQRLRHLFGELRAAAADQSFAHAIVQFAGRFHRERRADHTGRTYALNQCAFQFFRQAIRLAAARAGADERDV